MPDEVLSRRADAQRRQGLHAAGHQALPAGLVDRALPGLEHDNGQTGAHGIQGSAQAHRTAAHDHHVAGHVAHGETADCAGAVARARSSTRIRTRSRAALSTVKTAAVAQAECTSGSANPSSTTAT